jgi:WD40 repeat protein
MKYVEVPYQQFCALNFMADGRFLVSLHSSGIVRFWTMPDFTHRLAVRVRWIPSADHYVEMIGRFLLTPSFLYNLGDTVDRLEAPPEKPKKLDVFTQVDLEGFPGGSMLAWDKAHSRLIGGGWAELNLWNLEGKRLSSFSLPWSGRRSWWWHDRVVAPDGQWLAVGTSLGIYRVPLPQAPSDSAVSPAPLSDNRDFRRLCFSPDGRFLAAGAGRSAWLWDLSGQRDPVRFPAFRQFIERVAFHPSGRLFAAGSRDGEVRVYETGAAKELLRLDLDLGEIRGLAFAPDGMTAVAVGRDKRLAAWDVD